MISLYIHIPFCVKKCEYCDFLSAPASDEIREIYVDALCREIDAIVATSDRDVATIFIGGGTPSLLTVKQLSKIMTKIKDGFNLMPNAEISMECNPGTATYESLKGYREAGVNRLSIGLQSANDQELKMLGRIHTYSQFLDTYKWARDLGYTSVNIDIMSAIPGQSMESYMDTLTKVVSLKPSHVSAYSLIVEKGTPFYNGLPAPLPEEDDEREMYYMTERILGEAGYHRYEISNYALERHECQHNKVYWTGGDYVGVGIGAASYVNGVRHSNISDLNEYIKIWSHDDDNGSRTKSNADNDDKYSIVNKEMADKADKLLMTRTDICKLSKEDQMEEFMFVGLRLIQGVSKSRWKSIFACDIESIYGSQLKLLSEQGLIEQSGEWIRLTKRGIDISNVVLADFLL